MTFRAVYTAREVLKPYQSYTYLNARLRALPEVKDRNQNPYILPDSTGSYSLDYYTAVWTKCPPYVKNDNVQHMH